MIHTFLHLATILASFTISPGCPSAPGSPVSPVRPWAPFEPRAPCAPLLPGSPPAPLSPFRPFGPGGQTGHVALSPTCPGGPCSPGGPCNPVSPCGPGSPFCSGGQSLSTQKSGFAKEKNQSSYGPLNLENEHKSFHLSQEKVVPHTPTTWIFLSLNEVEEFS